MSRVQYTCDVSTYALRFLGTNRAGPQAEGKRDWPSGNEATASAGLLSWLVHRLAENIAFSNIKSRRKSIT